MLPFLINLLDWRKQLHKNLRMRRFLVVCPTEKWQTLGMTGGSCGNRAEGFQFDLHTQLCGSTQMKCPWHWGSYHGSRKASLWQLPWVSWHASEGVWDGKCAGGLRAQLHVPSVVRAAAHCLSSAVAQLALVAPSSSYRLSWEQKLSQKKVGFIHLPSAAFSWG